MVLILNKRRSALGPRVGDNENERGSGGNDIPHGLEDTMTLCPDDSISCVASRHHSSGHRSESSRRHSSKHSSRHESRHGSKSGSRHSKSGRESDSGSVVTVRRVGDRGSHATFPLGRGSGGSEGKKRSVVSMFGA